MLIGVLCVGNEMEWKSLPFRRGEANELLERSGPPTTELSAQSLPSSNARAWPGFDAWRLRKPAHSQTLQPGLGEHKPLPQRGSRELVAVM